jgi:CheY-like chemotaxis protein
VSTKRVLIIEDDDDIRELTQFSLEMVAGWAVSTASSGRQGLVVAEAERPDAILLDVMMPEMDGPATLQQLQANEHTRPIPIIFLTAKVHAADQRRLSKLGATGLITKPFDPMALPGQVAEALGWSTPG